MTQARHPAPATADGDPPPVVIRREAPRRIVDPRPAPSAHSRCSDRINTATSPPRRKSASTRNRNQAPIATCRTCRDLRSPRYPPPACCCAGSRRQHVVVAPIALQRPLYRTQSGAPSVAVTYARRPLPVSVATCWARTTKLWLRGAARFEHAAAHLSPPWRCRRIHFEPIACPAAGSHAVACGVSTSMISFSPSVRTRRFSTPDAEAHAHRIVIERRQSEAGAGAHANIGGRRPALRRDHRFRCAGSRPASADDSRWRAPTPFRRRPGAKPCPA